tara:strand:+ start:570 stop:992 length:423 start_codon:yes stop_codon:yes gene_type:complete
MKPACCYNHVSVHGSPQHVSELVSHVEGPKDYEFDHILNGQPTLGQLFSFRSIIPYEGTLDSGVNLDKWGSRCDAIDVRLDYCHGNYASYRFETYWTPPFKVAYALKTHFEDLYISWFFLEPQAELSGFIKSETKIKGVL